MEDWTGKVVCDDGDDADEDEDEDEDEDDDDDDDDDDEEEECKQYINLIAYQKHPTETILQIKHVQPAQLLT